MSNPIIDYWNKGGLKPLPMPLQSWLMSDVLQMNPDRPDIEFTAAGQIVGKLKETKSAKELFDNLVTGAIKAIESLKTCS